jgi:hypothetical protein
LDFTTWDLHLLLPVSRMKLTCRHAQSPVQKQG